MAVFTLPVLTYGQNTVQLPQMVITVQHTEYVRTQNSGAPNIINVSSSNSGVVTATKYRTDRVQIVAVGLGRANVQFFDSAQRVQYVQPVWVEAANVTGGGGTGYDKTKTQLQQITMLPRHTQNIQSPANSAPKNINGVRSSNPSVATARTDSSGSIQIYSVALGDTWIQFSDNGMTYQVHVWVRDAVNGTGGGGNNGGANSGGTGPKPNPQPDPIVKPGLRARPGANVQNGLDRCLVGSWKSQTTRSLDGVSFGGGVTMTIKSDGSTSISYDEMEAKKIMNPNGSINLIQTWRGKANGKIVAGNGTITVVRVDNSALTREANYGGKISTNPISGLGIVFLSSPYVISYSCGGNVLTLQSSLPGAISLEKYTFVKEN